MNSSDHFEGLYDASGRALQFGRSALWRVGKQVSRTWKTEDPGEVLRSAAFFQSLPDVEIEPEAVNLLWRSESLIVLSALGLDFFEDHIAGYTRAVFHDGPGHQSISEMLFGQDWDEIHRYMDTVPGSGIRGGGILHRLEHGHDLDALQTIYERHGLAGAMVWIQHNSQDLATPTGIPLPIGSGKLANWIVDRGWLTEGKAALAVSFNVVELAAAFLAGAFALRLASLMADGYRKRRIRRRCGRAADAMTVGDLEGAIANYKEAYSLSEGSPFIALSLGWCYASRKRPTAEGFLYFREAARGLAIEDVTVGLDGVKISLRGIAYLLALSEAPRILDQEHLRGHWREELETLWRSAMISFEQTAIRQAEPPGVDLGPVDVEWRPRRLSAAANYYLAARSCCLVPFLPQAEALRLARRSESMLGQAMQDHPDHRDELAAIRARWTRELRPWAEPLIEISSELSE